MHVVLKGLLPVLALVAAWSLGAWWSPPPAGAQAPAPAQAQAPAPASATGATRIAFIDSQRVVARSAAGRSRPRRPRAREGRHAEEARW